MNLQLKLKSLRKIENITQEELAKKIKINLSTYKQYETNRTEPDIETLKKIADYFDISLDFLCDRPRPYDLPSIITHEQKVIIYKIIDLNKEQCMLVDAYIEGLKVGQQKHEETIKRLKGE